MGAKPLQPKQSEWRRLAESRMAATKPVGEPDVRTAVEALRQAVIDARLNDDPLRHVIEALALHLQVLDSTLGGGVRQEELERAMHRAALVVARQMGTQLDTRIAVSVGIGGVLIALLSGLIGYGIGTGLLAL